MKTKLIIAFFLISSGMQAMHDEGNTINLLKAIEYVNKNKKENEIVICRLHLTNTEEHIAARNARQESYAPASAALDTQMRGIVNKSIENIRGLELWEWNKPPFIAENINRAQFIVYAVFPTKERNLAIQSSIRGFKEDKKSFVIAIREDGEDVQVKQLKNYLPDHELVFFPQPANYFSRIFMVGGIAVVIGFLCYFRWGR